MALRFLVRAALACARFTGVVVRLLTMLALVAVPAAMHAAGPQGSVLVRDLTQVEGVRGNQLVGYGLVVGLHSTGDSQQTFFTVQTLANAMQRMGVQIQPSVAVVKNVAAVFVTAELPPFSEPGMKLDITASSVGDAKSLQGGVLLLTALRGVDGQVYAEAQGPLTIGGYAQGSAASSKTVNHPTVGMVAGGAMVERGVASDMSHLKAVSLLLREPDFTASHDIAEAINHDFGRPIAAALDSRRVEVDVQASGLSSVPLLLSRIQNLSIEFHPPAKVVVNERTGTIVIGGDVKLSPVSVVQGSLTIQVQTMPVIAAPIPVRAGTAPAAQTTVERTTVSDQAAQSIQLQAGASVEELIKGLHAIGATSRDIISILQAIKSAGGLQAELEVI